MIHPLPHAYVRSSLQMGKKTGTNYVTNLSLAKFDELIISYTAQYDIVAMIFSYISFIIKKSTAKKESFKIIPTVLIFDAETTDDLVIVLFTTKSAHFSCLVIPHTPRSPCIPLDACYTKYEIGSMTIG